MIAMFILIVLLKLGFDVHELENQIYIFHTLIDRQALTDWTLATAKKNERGEDSISSSKAKRTSLVKSNAQIERGTKRKSRTIHKIPLPKSNMVIWSFFLITSFSVYAILVYYGLGLSKSVSDNYGDLIQHNANILFKYVEVDYLALSLVFYKATRVKIAANLTSRIELN
jgi:hypothetical protein